MNQNLMDFDIGADKLREECGVFGMYDFDGNDVASDHLLRAVCPAAQGTGKLRHRGQRHRRAQGEGRRSTRGWAFATRYLTPEHAGTDCSGNIGVGHVRYSTAGSSTRENAQPLVLNYVKGTLGLAHNGNLVNAPAAAP